MDPLVIVIDDSLVIRKILEASLQRAGVRVITFADGLAFLHALTDQAKPVPQFIVLDVGLPRLDGYTIARTHRRQPACTPILILMLSGHTGRLEPLRARFAGAQAYLTKPFHPAAVLAVIQSYLANRRKHRRSGAGWLTTQEDQSTKEQADVGAHGDHSLDSVDDGHRGSRRQRASRLPPAALLGGATAAGGPGFLKGGPL